MKIELEFEKENGEVVIKEFTSVRLRSRAFKQALEIRDKLKNKVEGDFAEEDIDSLVKIVNIVFGNQFTQDEFYDGIYADDLMVICTKAQEELGNSINSKMNTLAKN